MNLSGNYSQMKSKLAQPQATALTANSKKYNYSSFEDNDPKIDSRHPRNDPLPNPRNDIARNESTRTNEPYLERNNSNLSNPDRNPSSIDREKRPRVNASLNGPMTREKIDSSTARIDNYLKSDTDSDNPRTAKPIERTDRERERPLPAATAPLATALLPPAQLGNSQVGKSKEYPKREAVLVSQYEMESSELN